MTDPQFFADSFLNQPFPTMGLSPSAAITRTGGSGVVQEGGNELGKTGSSMWARIASAIPFGWTLTAGVKAAKAVNPAVTAVQEKVAQGAQAVNGQVKSSTSGIFDSVTGFFKGYVSYTKWVVVGVVAIALIVFLAQIKTLVRD